MERAGPEAAPPRVLLDANILIALAIRGDRYAVARLALAGRIRPIVCEYVLREAGRMLQRAFPDRAASLEARLRALGAEWIAEPERGFPPVPAALRDPSDLPVLAAARAAGADAVVTSDRALREDAAGFEIPVLSVPELLARYP